MSEQVFVKAVVIYLTCMHLLRRAVAWRSYQHARVSCGPLLPPPITFLDLTLRTSIAPPSVHLVTLNSKSAHLVLIRSLDLQDTPLQTYR